MTRAALDAARAKVRDLVKATPEGFDANVGDALRSVQADFRIWLLHPANSAMLHEVVQTFIHGTILYVKQRQEQHEQDDDEAEFFRLRRQGERHYQYNVSHRHECGE
ncbi:MAG: hypothetical protein AB7G08_23915 [Hyphomicrobiaceae bacterium]